MHDRNISLTSKGKGKESMHWQLGWWDLIHSLEGTRRPIQWSKSSVIFTPHEYQPYILGRHFPSSRQFILPPPQITSTLYEPATILALCPTDDWIFAYFPGKRHSSLGCIWHKEAQVDSWTLKECLQYPIGIGVVCAAWTQSKREWTFTEAGTSTRLPPRGPMSTDGSSMLLLVTEAHMIHVHSISPTGKVEPAQRATLLHPIHPSVPSKDPEQIGKLGGDRVCVKAAIGLYYQDATAIVAMRSQLLPSQNSTQGHQNPMDLGLSIDLGQPPSESPNITEWELWGEEQVISLCEIRIEARRGVPPVISRPLATIHHAGRLVDMAFYCPPPPAPDQKEPHTLHLVTTFSDVEDYTSLPKCEIVAYTMRTGAPQGTYWTMASEHKRPCPPKVPCFLVPSVLRGGLVAGFLDAGGLLPRQKSKSTETTTGTIEVLKLPDLTTHENWESIPIHSHIQAGTIDVPVSAALSPNEALICCVSSPLLGSHMSIQALPRRFSGELTLASNGHFHEDLSKLLVTAIRSRHSPSDVIHALAMPSLPLEASVNTLSQALSIMETNAFGLPDLWTAEIIGIAAELYSARAQKLDRSAEQDLCASRWQTAYEIASMSACCAALDACREGDSYDLDAVWQLLGMTTWVIEFIEKLFKECIFVGERPDSGPSTSKDTAGTTLDSPIFLHLSHPYALSRLQAAAKHIKRFHDQVAKLPPKGENSHIARDVLIDSTEGSGVDLALLVPLLADIMQDCKKLDAQDLRRSLASCAPAPALRPHLRRSIDRIVASKAIDRARLFVKPADLSDGLARLALADRQGVLRPDPKLDVVRKGLLWRQPNSGLCTRCGGRSDVIAERKAGYEAQLSRWQVYEKGWQQRCVCGGLWATTLG